MKYNENKSMIGVIDSFQQCSWNLSNNNFHPKSLASNILKFTHRDSHIARSTAVY